MVSVGGRHSFEQELLAVTFASPLSGGIEQSRELIKMSNSELH